MAYRPAERQMRSRPRRRAVKAPPPQHHSLQLAHQQMLPPLLMKSAFQD
jgi:hypothetical protein